MESNINNNKKTTLIFTGGRYDGIATAFVMDKYKYERIIVADSGLQTIENLAQNTQYQLKPDFIIGDFDSMFNENLIAKYEKQGSIIRRYPRDKDDTDTEIAVKLALELGTERIVLIGATGTRIDHLLGNIYLLSYIDKNGVEGIIIDNNNRISIISGEKEVAKNDLYGGFISFLPICGEVKGLTLSGFYYDLNNVNWPADYTTGISNEIYADNAKVSIESGKLLMIESCD